MSLKEKLVTSKVSWDLIVLEKLSLKTMLLTKECVQCRLRVTVQVGMETEHKTKLTSHLLSLLLSEDQNKIMNKFT